MASLIQIVEERNAFQAQLVAHEDAAKAESARIRAEIVALQTLLNNAQAGLDADKIETARAVLNVRGTYAKAGEDRASVIQDAINWLATGKCSAYQGLDTVSFGTKSYDRWHGQRCDCSPGCGPRHGSIIFQVGLKDRERELSADEREAAIYYLINLERAQTAASDAQAVAA